MKLRVSKVAILDFLSVEKALIHFADGKSYGIVGEISGNNTVDSNGAGKSALLDAVFWALSGYTFREADNVQRKGSAVCSVEVELEGDNCVYLITRKKKQSSGSLGVLQIPDVGNIVTLTGSSMADTQKVINSIIGVDPTILAAAFPGARSKISKMTDVELKHLLESITNTGKLAQAHVAAKAKLAEHKAAVNTIQADCNAFKSVLSYLNENIANTKKVLETHNEELHFLVGKRKALAHEAVDLESSLQQINKPKLVQLLKAMNEGLESRILTVNNSNAKIDGIIKTVKAKEQSIKYGSHITSCDSCGQTISKEMVDQKIKVTQDEIKNLNDVVAGLVHSQVNLKQEITTLGNMIIDLKKQIADAEALEKKREEIAAKLEGVSSAIDAYNSMNAIQEQQEKNIKAKATAESQLKEQTEKLSKAEANVEEYTFWVSAFSNSGIKTELLTGVVDQINTRLSKYSSILTGGDLTAKILLHKTLKNGTVKEQAHVECTSSTGAMSYNNLSTGEQSRVNLAISLAILDAVMVNCNLSWVAVDEAFDGLDETGFAVVATVLEHLSKKYSNVVVISHNQHIKDVFDHKIVATKTGDVTTYVQN